MKRKIVYTEAVCLCNDPVKEALLNSYNAKIYRMIRVEVKDIGVVVKLFNVDEGYAKQGEKLGGICDEVVMVFSPEQLSDKVHMLNRFEEEPFPVQVAFEAIRHEILRRRATIQTFFTTPSDGGEQKHGGNMRGGSDSHGHADLRPDDTRVPLTA